MSNKLLKSRAWIEINLHNLKHNIYEIEKMLPAKCQIIAVVKANAYGHGLVPIAKKLNKLGITNFATATIEEAITLRKNHVKGNILILGYTSPENIKYVLKYNLIQTIVDEDYLELLAKLPLKKIRAHLKVNTGMNRLGFNPQNTSAIEKAYRYPNIIIEGIYTHLCCADSKKKEDIAFTQKQIETFNNLVKYLKQKGIDPGKIHLQSSYGLVNYPHLNYDYVRVGLIMYGIYSTEDTYQKRPLDLKPVLSLKAKVTSVREITKGESVSYGRTYTSKAKEKIAVVSLGYADGYPRSLSNKKVKVLVNDHYENIIGKICMDQLIISVSKDNSVEVGDTVTLIGSEDEITASKISSQAETISYELLSRLGNRLGIVYLDEK